MKCGCGVLVKAACGKLAFTWDSCTPEGLGESARAAGGGGGVCVCCVRVHINPKPGFPKMRIPSSSQEAHRNERKLKLSVASYTNLLPCLPFSHHLHETRGCVCIPTLRPPGPLQAPFPLHLFLAIPVQRRGTSAVSQGLLEGLGWAGEGELESLALQPSTAVHTHDGAGGRGVLSHDDHPQTPGHFHHLQQLF